MIKYFGIDADSKLTYIGEFKDDEEAWKCAIEKGMDFIDVGSGYWWQNIATNMLAVIRANQEKVVVVESHSDAIDVDKDIERKHGL